MREKLKITEGIFPMPVLMIATYNEDGSVNVMNAAWGTMQERDTVALNLTESHKTVKHATCLLGIHEIHVDFAGILDGVEDCRFCYFLEDNTFRVFLIESESLEKMP